MQGVLDSDGPGADAGQTNSTSSWWSFSLRLGLGVGAVWAAWFIMTDPWPAGIIAKVFITVSTGSVPGSIGSLLASLR